jgi:hypothetical protein
MANGCGDNLWGMGRKEERKERGEGGRERGKSGGGCYIWPVDGRETANSTTSQCDRDTDSAAEGSRRSTCENKRC